MDYPYPTQNIINVPLKFLNETFVIIIYSSTGQKVSYTSTKTRIGISSFTNGIYFLTLNQNGSI